MQIVKRTQSAWERGYWSGYLLYHMTGQRRFPFRKLHEILATQQKRLRDTILHAYRYVPYYRETMHRLDLTPDDFRTAEDLQKLPLLTRADLQRDPERFVSQMRPLASYLELTTGGSTGTSIHFFYDRAALYQNAAHGERERAIYIQYIGRQFGYRETLIGSPISAAYEIQAHTHHHAWIPRGVRIERQYLALGDSPAVNVARINAFRPDILHSYGSYLPELFGYVRRTSVPFHLPKVVTYSSDMLTQGARELVESFGVEVFSQYQATEALKIAFECQAHQGMHCNIDLYPLRIADENGVSLPPGQIGDIVISNLVSRGTIVLNYMLGDRGYLLSTPCPCGRALPLLGQLVGRSDDWVLLPGKRQIHSQPVRVALLAGGQTWQWQLIQHALDRFEALIVPAPKTDHSALQRQITLALRQLLGPDIQLTVRCVEHIPRSGNKFRSIVKYVPSNETS